MATRIGVDVGGTFTDLIFYDDETGEVRVGKVPTTPAAPDEGVLDAISAAAHDRARRRVEVLPARHDGRAQLAARAHRRDRRPAGDARASATSSRSAAATATIRTTSSGSRRRRSCRAACASASPSGCARTATVHRPLETEATSRGGRGLRGGGRRRASRSRSSTRTPTRRTSSRPSRRCATSGFDGEISLSHRVSGEYREYERTHDDGDRRVRPPAHGGVPAPARGAARRRRLRAAACS